jgi:hypothetical protein
MKKFICTIKFLDGSELSKFLIRKTLEDALVASGGFVGSMPIHDAIVDRIIVREHRPESCASNAPYTSNGPYAPNGPNIYAQLESIGR